MHPVVGKTMAQNSAQRGFLVGVLPRGHQNYLPDPLRTASPQPLYLVKQEGIPLGHQVFPVYFLFLRQL